MHTTTNINDRPPVHVIEREELRQKLAAGSTSLKLVFSLTEWAFHAKHIPGSIHFNTPEEMLAALKKDDEIIVYCSNVACRASITQYWLLIDNGYTNVRRYAAGLVDWEEGNLPLEGEWIKEEGSAKS